MDSEVSGVIIILTAVLLGVVSIALIEGNPAKDDQQRVWADDNIEENYTVQDSEVKFNNGVPRHDDESTRFFTIEGLADDHKKITVEGYLDFDEQVVVIADDADGSVLPLEGSDAERVLAEVE